MVVDDDNDDDDDYGALNLLITALSCCLTRMFILDYTHARVFCTCIRGTYIYIYIYITIGPLYIILYSYIANQTLKRINEPWRIEDRNIVIILLFLLSAYTYYTTRFSLL